MLAKIAPRFVISRVIQHSYYANYMAVQLTKQIIGESAVNFYISDAKKYHECNFYGYLSSLPAPTQFDNQFQKQKYEEAVQKFKEYNSARAVFAQLNEFTLELRELYRVIQANNSSSNIFGRSANIDETFEADILNALDRYNLLLRDLQAYPEWRDKVIQQVGKWLHLIHTNLSESETKHQIFNRLNRQDYFV